MSKEEETPTKPSKSKLVALKDFHLFQPPHIDIEIKKGDDLADIPKLYHENLKTEGVLKG